MRELKFRAFDTTTKNMIYLELRHVSSFAHQDYYKLMQYTGLKDRRGVEIYEGDIVKGNNGWDNEGDALQVVRYENGTWNYSYAIHEYAEHPERDWEVIGNIYQNPKMQVLPLQGSMQQGGQE